MKRLLLITAALAMCSAVSTAQTVRSMYNPDNTDGRTDTVSNATPMLLKGSQATSGPLGIHFLATKVSGTVAGTAYLEMSIDPAALSYVTVDSIVLSNQTTNQRLISYANNTASKFQWRIVPTGTQKFKVWSWQH